MHPNSFEEREKFLLSHLTKQHVPNDVRDHSLDVAKLAIILAQVANLSTEEQEIMYLSGLGHDVGKLHPDYLGLLNGKTDFSSPAVRDARYNHPILGAEFLANNRFPFLCIQIGLQHHERYDGTGYPNGLKGYQIAPFSKLFGLVDYLSSLKYRGPNGSPAVLDIEQRADIISGEFGTCLDPNYEPVFDKLIEYLLTNQEITS